MSQYDNEKRGVLFKNEQKKADKHPDYSGDATIEGVEYFMDAWLKASESGRRYMSFSFKAKDKQPAPAPAREPSQFNMLGGVTGNVHARPAQPLADMDDDVPF